MSTESLRDVRDHLSEVIDRAEHHHERVVVTRNGKPAAVIMSPEDLAQLQETIDVLSDPLALADIREADASYAAAMSFGGSTPFASCARDRARLRDRPNAPSTTGHC
jgi:prevent-host-death family protein